MDDSFLVQSVIRFVSAICTPTLTSGKNFIDFGHFIKFQFSFCHGKITSSKQSHGFCYVFISRCSLVELHK